jgi:hypothetical protein
LDDLKGTGHLTFRNPHGYHRSGGEHGPLNRIPAGTDGFHGRSSRVRTGRKGMTRPRMGST